MLFLYEWVLKIIHFLLMDIILFLNVQYFDLAMRIVVSTIGTPSYATFLDLNINNNDRQYAFKVYRKNAITNVLKPNSGHDPKILRGIFTRFLQVCSQQHQQEKLTSWFKTLLITATKNTNLFISWTNFNEREATRHQHHLRTQTQHNLLCYLGYLG